MKDLKQKFEAARLSIENPQEHTFHYPLLEISRAVNASHSTKFNPEGLSAHSIDPDEFRAAWALGYARETLSQGKPDISIYAEVTMKRCQTCLSEEGELAFGTVLDERTKQRVQDQYDALAKAYSHLRMTP